MEEGKRAINNNEVRTFDHALAKVSTELKKGADLRPLGWHWQVWEVGGLQPWTGPTAEPEPKVVPRGTGWPWQWCQSYVNGCHLRS